MAATLESSANVPIRDEHASGTESSPLLGEPGDVLQRPGESLVSNLYKGAFWQEDVPFFLRFASIHLSIHLAVSD